MRVLAAGGGGYGPPAKRAVERVCEDVRLGYVSREAACTDYSVEIDEDGAVKWSDTERLRAAKQDSREEMD